MRRRLFAGRDERGSLAVEMAVVVPSLLLIFGLIYAYGRAATVNGTLESGTRDAARSATIARSYDDAQERAENVVRAAIVDLPRSCQKSLVVTVSDTFFAGEPVTVDAECTYSLSDIGLPGAPGSITPQSSFTSMLDPYRGIESRDERGSIAPSVPIIAMALLLLGGLTIDGSRQLNARGEAVAFAEEAARAGAQGVDIDADELVLDEGQARQRVAQYCTRVLQLGQVTECRFVRVEEVSGTDRRRLVVVTHVGTEIQTSLLGLVGKYTLSASGDARARPYEGIEEAIEP